MINKFKLAGKNSSKKYMFEPGDYLTKLAGIPLKGSSPMEIKNQVEGLISEKIAKAKTSRTINIKSNISSLDGESLKNKGIQGSYKNLNGILSLKYPFEEFNMTATIPFFVRNGEILQFDTIEFGGKKFVYTDKNLYLIISSMEEISKNPYILDEDSSYAGLEEQVNNLSDAGSLRQILDIRNREMAISGSGIERLASKEVDELLEKTYSLKPIDDKYLEAVEFQAEKIAYEVLEEQFEKKAANINDLIEESLQSATVFSKLKEFNWKNAKDVEDKSVVEIYDIPEDSGEGELKKAKLFKGRKLFIGKKYGYGPDNDKDLPPEIIDTKDLVIYDETKNIKVLREKSKLYNEYKVADTNQELSLKGTTLNKELKEKEIRNKMFFIVNKNDIIGPIEIHPRDFEGNEVWDESYHGTTHKKKINKDRIRNVVLDISPALPGDRSYLKDRTHSITAAINTELKEDEKVKFATEEESTSFLENIIKTKEDMLSFEYNFGNHLMFLHPDTRLLEVKGFINTPVTSLKQIIFEGNDDELKKVASDDKVIIKKPVPDLNEYHITMNKGSKKKVFRSRNRNEVYGILKLAEIDDSEISAMLAYLDSGEKEIERILPLNFDGFEGKDLEDKKGDLVKKHLSKLFDPNKSQYFAQNVANNMGNEIVSSQLADVARDVGPSAFEALDILSSLASDSSALADRMEKIAIDNESHDFQDVAKLMVLTNRIDEMIVKSANDGETFDLLGIEEEFKNIIPSIEKAAAEIHNLRNEQEVLGKVIGDNTVIQSLRTLDRLKKYTTLF